MKIAVFGLGYVGCISAACFARAGHKVTGVDVSEDKVNIINDAKSPIIEPGLEDILSSVVKSGQLHATTNFKEAVANSDISLVCVGTPSAKNGSVTLDYIYRVAQQIGEALRDVDHYHVFVIRSTVPPGTHERCLQIIAEASGKKAGEHFGACSNPEFLREGCALKDFYNPPYTIIGEMDEKSGQYLAEIYSHLDAPLVRTDVKVAEMVKYANNTFHALKVAFGNEMGTICKAEGVDSHKLMDIFCMDTKLNLSPYYLKPGFAFGGSCLPKDVRALTYRGRDNDLDLPLLNSIMPSNQSHIERSIEQVIDSGKKKVGVLGLSFKGNTDDLRESPMVDVVERLIGKGYDLKIYDKNVHLARLFGANKEYINNKIPHISSLMVAEMQDVVDHAEVLVIGNHSPEFKELVQTLEGDKLVIDYVRIVKELDSIKTKYDGLAW